MALVSVIIPTTGRPKLVLRALASVLGQTHGELEVIVVVDGPNPETIAALGGIADPRVRVLQNRESLGPGPARNIGAAQARGEWIAFLDDDDEWMPQKLEIQLAGASVDEIDNAQLPMPGAHGPCSLRMAAPDLRRQCPGG